VKTRFLKQAVVIGIVGAITFGEAAPSFAAPVPSSAAAVNTQHQICSIRSAHAVAGMSAPASRSA